MADRIRDVGEVQMATSIIIVLSAMEVLPLEEPTDRVYGTLRARLEQKGHVVGGNDVLIAAQAISLGFTLVTANEREFAKLKDLRCDNWLS